ncbi:Ig-like domain-containing protein [candidate division KSB1 bacterium]|nr:Ig-like domain-containing protein [candidate division KSB1 bacterium]
MGDINNDGRPDIYISNAVRYANKLAETLYISIPGGKYQENDQARGVSDNYGWTGSHGICFVDYDNDGDYDIFNATTDDRNRLYQNDGNGFFADVTDAAQLPLNRTVFPGFDSEPYGYGTRGVVAFDANNDGFMDLLGVNWGPAENRYDLNVAIVIPPQPNEFYLNKGDGTFLTIENSGLTHPPNTSYMGTQGVTAADVDNDGDMDILIVHRNYTSITEDGRVINDFNREVQVFNQLMINDGHGNFTNESVERGLDDAWNDANGATFADFDNDGDLDLFVPPKDKSRTYLTAYQNDGNGYFRNISKTLQIPQAGFSTFFLDADNDTDLDIIVTRTRSVSSFYENVGGGVYQEIKNAGVEIPSVDPRGGAVGDIDDDGDLDLYIADANKDAYPIYSNRLFRNDQKTGNHWLKITGRGPGGDMGGFGTKIWVFERGFMDDMSRLLGYRQVINAYGYLCQDDPVQHFGLGMRDSVDVKVQLLDGTTLFMNAAPAKKRLFFTRPRQVTKISGDQQSGPGFTQLAQPLRVQVHDPFGNVVYGGKVIFSSSDPAGVFAPAAQVYTDKYGYAQVRYQLGGDTSQTITVQCENEPNFSASFTANSTESTPPQMAMVAGDQQKAGAGELLPQPLSVRITRANGTPFQGFNVDFRIVQGEATLEPSSRIQTDATGIASVNLRLGLTPGIIIIHAEAASVINSPIVFTAFFQSSSTISLVSGDQQAGVVGQRLPQELVVRAEYLGGGNAANVPVTFTVVSGGGHIDGAPAKTVLSDGQGIARIAWTLGAIAGLQTLTATSEDNSVDFTATAAAGDPVTMMRISGDGQVLNPGLVFPQSFVVKVVDAYGNPKPNHAVNFMVKAGNGHINGAMDLIVMTDQQGLARVMWTPDPYLGPTNTLQAESSFQGILLDSSPVLWSFPGIAVDAQKSTISVTSPVMADGTSRSDIVVTLRNAQNQTVGAGLTVQINVSGSENNLQVPNPETDAGGQVFATLTSPLAENKVVTVIVKGLELELSNHPTIVFQAIYQVPDRIVIVAGNDQTVVVNQASQPLTVRILDTNSQPIFNYTVTFAKTLGEGSFDGLPIKVVKTTADGLASVVYTTDKRAGIVSTIEARADVVTNSPALFTLTSAASEPRKLTIMAGNNQQGTPNSTLPQALSVSVTDIYDNPIAQYPVLFKVNIGQCTLNGAAQSTAFTNSEGLASVQVTLGEQEGQSIIEAKTGFASVIFTLMTTAGLADPDLTLSTITATSPVLADGLSTSNIVVTIFDKFNRPIEGAKVKIMVTGQGVRLMQPDSLTNSNGQVKAGLSATLPGEKIVYASVLPQNLIIQNTATVVFERGNPRISIVSGQGQEGTVGQECAQPLVVLLKNGDNLFASQYVRFTVAAGGGNFGGQDTLLLKSDASGQASVHYILGTTAGVNTVHACMPVSPDDGVTFTIIGHSGLPAKIIKYAGDEQTGHSNNALEDELTVQVTDSFNNPTPHAAVTFSGVDGGAIVPPATVLTDSSGFASATAMLGSRMGRYTFKAMLPDGTLVLFGATAAHTNSAPQVIAYLPIENELTFAYGDRLSFEIQAFDPDDDAIFYSWYINSHRVGNQARLSLYMSQIFGATNFVTCMVSDGQDSTSVGWSLSLGTRVDLSAFHAEHIQRKGILLTWSTNAERDNLGFRILRATPADGDYQPITTGLIKSIATVGSSYRFTDAEKLPVGTFYYLLESIAKSGQIEQFGPISATVQAPAETVLLQNYPNPFNPTTTFAFDLPAATHVRLVIYNQKGQLLRELVESEMPAGSHTVLWDGRDDDGLNLPTGIYLYRMTAGDYSETKKLTLMK